MESRLQKGGLNSQIKSSIQKFLKQKPEEVVRVDTPLKRGRCKMCEDELPKGEGWKRRKSNLGKHSDSCTVCNRNVCDKHKICYCENCHQRMLSD